MGRITASRTQLKGDPQHDSLLASKFINCLMNDGKKTVAQRLFYDALSHIKKKFPEQEPLEVFTQAVENVKPQIEVRSKRVGGAAYKSPCKSTESVSNLWRYAGSCWRFERRRGVPSIWHWPRS